MPQPDFLIIANPTSGKKAAPELAEGVLKRLRDAGRSAELELTKAAGDAKKIAHHAAGKNAPVVVACGGDGTLQEVASSLAGTETVMGILPGGRCNDLASALKIFKKDKLDTLAKRLLDGKRSPIDLGKYEALDPKGNVVAGSERIFCTVATLGFDTQVSRFVEQNKLPVRGTMAYLYGVVRVISEFKPIPVIMKGDFGTYDDKIILVASGNTASYGGAMQIAPSADPTDGLFDMCVVGNIPKTTLLRVLPKVFSGKHIKHPFVKIIRSANVSIWTTDGPQWVCADGETLGQTPAKLSVLPNRLKIISTS